MLWIFANLVAGYVMSQFRKRNMTWLLIAVAYALVIFQLMKLTGAVAYFFKIYSLRHEMARNIYITKASADLPGARSSLMQGLDLSS